MSKYAEYDKKLQSLIAGGCNTFDALLNRLRDDNKALCPPPDSFRVTDRRLQALRKAGKIYFDRSKQAWFENEQPRAPVQ